MNQYIFNIAHLATQALNTLLGGDPRMTLSARMGGDIEAGTCLLCHWVCRLLDRFETDHCKLAWDKEKLLPIRDMQVVGE